MAVVTNWLAADLASGSYQVTLKAWCILYYLNAERVEIVCRRVVGPLLILFEANSADAVTETFSCLRVSVGNRGETFMRHVLIIEDQPLIAGTLADFAMFAGASSVAIADSEVKAIAAAREHPPRVIFSDVDLGSGGRGPNAVAAIHAIVGAVPAIFITGETDDDDARSRATAMLAKPVAAHRLQSVFSEILANSHDPRPTFGGQTAGAAQPRFS